MSRCCRTLYESLLEGIRRGSPQTARTSRALRLPCNKSADIGKVADNRLASLPAKPCKILHLASSGRFLTNRETLCRDLSLYPRDMARVFQYSQALQAMIVCSALSLDFSSCRLLPCFFFKLVQLSMDRRIVLLRTQTAVVLLTQLLI